MVSDPSRFSLLKFSLSTSPMKFTINWLEVFPHQTFCYMVYNSIQKFTITATVKAIQLLDYLDDQFMERNSILSHNYVIIKLHCKMIGQNTLIEHSTNIFWH